MYKDYHVHSAYSHDSVYDAEQIVKDAIALGMDELCFTEHADYEIKEDGRIVSRKKEFDFLEYQNHVRSLNEKYSDIDLKVGMEFGVEKTCVSAFEEVFDMMDLDFVILSCHQINALGFAHQKFQKGKTQKEYNEAYYECIYESMKAYKNYSVLGHLDLVSRYDLNGVYPFECIKPQIEKILKLAIQDGKGIELNTSHLRYGLKDTTPCKDILLLYKELGGTIITVGSDTHKKEHLGEWIQEGYAYLKELGFEYVCTFEKMKPIYHKL